MYIPWQSIASVGKDDLMFKLTGPMPDRPLAALNIFCFDVWLWAVVKAAFPTLLKKVLNIQFN